MRIIKVSVSNDVGRRTSKLYKHVKFEYWERKKKTWSAFSSDASTTIALAFETENFKARKKIV